MHGVNVEHCGRIINSAPMVMKLKKPNLNSTHAHTHKHMLVSAHAHVNSKVKFIWSNMYM